MENTLVDFGPPCAGFFFCLEEVMLFVSDFILRFNNARTVVRQIRNGEWSTRASMIDGVIYTARRENYRLWLANGPFFCEIDEFNEEKCKPAFGFIWRHYVWWAAARRLKSAAEYRKAHTPVLK